MENSKKPTTKSVSKSFDDVFFRCDILGMSMKSDHVSMEVPIFSLSTKPDTTPWHWVSKNGERSVTVTPTIYGRATQFDKDVLIYLTSQLTEGINRNREDSLNRTIRFTVFDYLVTTKKQTGGKEYLRLEEALKRLMGTMIQTNIVTGGTKVKEAFALIESWKIIERGEDERMMAVEVTVSKWLHNAILKKEILTINPDYFSIRKPLSRRIYELARKHVGRQTEWTIGLDLLREKSGSKSSPKEFKRQLKIIASEDLIPDYRIAIIEDKDQICFYTRDMKKFSEYLLGKMVKI